MPSAKIVSVRTERLFVTVNDKIKWKFSIILFYNGESRGFITLIHIMASKFNIVITIFKTCRRKISILNTKYYESPFENFRVWKNDIIITNISKKNSNKLNNEYYNLESIFDKFILWIWTCQKPSDARAGNLQWMRCPRSLVYVQSCTRRYLLRVGEVQHGEVASYEFRHCYLQVITSI